MDIKLLKALLAVADTGNVTKASEQLHLVQPAVSRQIKMLEEELGVRLFFRTSQGMMITEEGKILVAHSRKIMLELNEARQEISACAERVSGSVTLGLLPSLCEMFSVPIFSQIAKNYPGIHLNIVSGYAGHLREGLNRGSIDCALVYASEDNEHNFFPFLEEELWLVSSQSDPVPPEGTFKEMLSNVPLILPSLPHGIRRVVNNVARKQKIHLYVVAETDAMEVQKKLVEAGVGMTILPSIAIQSECLSGRFTGTPIGQPHLVRNLGFLLPSVNETLPATRHVMTILDQCLRQLIEGGHWPHARLLN